MSRSVPAAMSTSELWASLQRLAGSPGASELSELQSRIDKSWVVTEQVGEDFSVLCSCIHGVDLDREFCPEGCRA